MFHRVQYCEGAAAMTGIQEAVNYYIADCETRVSMGEISYYYLKSIKTNMNRVKQFLETVETVDKINKKTLDKYGRWRVSMLRDIKFDSLRHEERMLQGFIYWLYEHGYMEEKVTFKKTKGKTSRRGAFTARNLITVLHYLKNHKRSLIYYYYVRFLLACGARPGEEVMNVRWCDVDVSGEYPVIYFRHSKTVAGNAVARKSLHIIMWGLRRELQPKSETETIFGRHTGNSYCNAFRVAVLGSGVKDVDGNTLSLYSLRHMYITSLLKNNTNPYAIAVNTRTSLRMIQQNYSHVVATDFAKTLYQKR